VRAVNRFSGLAMVSASLILPISFPSYKRGSRRPQAKGGE
jgi:hypothetical protein